MPSAVRISFGTVVCPAFVIFVLIIVTMTASNTMKLIISL